MKFSSSPSTHLAFIHWFCLGSFLEITDWTWVLSHRKCMCSNEKWMIWLCVKWLSREPSPDTSRIISEQNAVLQFLGMQNRSPKFAFDCVNKHWWMSTHLIVFVGLWHNEKNRTICRMIKVNYWICILRLSSSNLYDFLKAVSLCGYSHHPFWIFSLLAHYTQKCGICCLGLLRSIKWHDFSWTMVKFNIWSIT